jgi:hypothetical protein
MNRLASAYSLSVPTLLHTANGAWLLSASQLGAQKIVLARGGGQRPKRKFMGQLFLTLRGQPKYSKEKAKKRRATKNNPKK